MSNEPSNAYAPPSSDIASPHEDDVSAVTPTATTRYADVVLPATTFVEHRDLASGYGSYALASVEPVIDPVGEARSNHEVFGLFLLQH